MKQLKEVNPWAWEFIEYYMQCTRDNSQYYIDPFPTLTKKKTSKARSDIILKESHDTTNQR